jgi:DNA-binding transcriptional LysR family regulator
MPYASETENLDLRQLHLLQMLLAERSVSRVATILRQSQPAVSAGLKRLREIFGDPLLVRSGQSMVLTERAEDIRLTVDLLLDDLHRLIDGDDVFDPSQLRRQIRIAAANCFEIFLIPRLVAAFRAEAPHATLEFTAPHSPSEFAHEMEAGQLDAVIGNYPVPPQNLRYMALMKSDIACLVAGDHPLAGQNSVDLETYLSLNHISPTTRRQYALSPIDGVLAGMQLSRRIAITVPDYALVQQLMPGSDLVFTTGRPYADHVAKSGDFRVLDAPVELGMMTFYLLWHDRSQFSKYHHWLRGVVRRVAKSASIFNPLLPLEAVREPSVAIIGQPEQHHTASVITKR